MFTKSLVAGLALAASVSAQMVTDCNPTTTTCPPQAALGKKIECGFSAATPFGDVCPEFTMDGSINLSYEGDFGALTISDPVGVPAQTIASNKFIYYGKVEVELQAAPQSGVVTAVVLVSKSLDEIDLEWVGKDHAQVQSNFFGRGDERDYTRGVFHPVDEPMAKTHKYGIEWTEGVVEFFIDDVSVRQITRESAAVQWPGYPFPEGPMEVRLGVWVAGGVGARQGTIEWCGAADYSQAPYKALFKSVTVTDYAGTKGPNPPVVAPKEYSYADMSGAKINIIQ